MAFLPFGFLWLIFWRSGAHYLERSRRPAAAGYIIFSFTSQTELQHRFTLLTSLFGCCLTNHRRVLAQTRRSYSAGRRVWPATLLQRCLGRCIRFCYCTRRMNERVGICTQHIQQNSPICSYGLRPINWTTVAASTISQLYFLGFTTSLCLFRHRSTVCLLRPFPGS